MGHDFKKPSVRNLVIGDTSQIACFFSEPENTKFISSRDIDIDKIISKKWGKIYLCAAEQRTFLKSVSFNDYNVDKTIEIINQIKGSCEQVVVFSTTELWNKTCGAVNLETPYDFIPTPYILSKKQMTDIIINNPDVYNNVVVLFPFNFNSTKRSPGFLFHKVFNSIIQKEKIEIGNTYFYRELLHPTYVSNQAILSSNHSIIGSGRVTFVNDFIRDLYKHFGMKYDDYVKENLDGFKTNATRGIFYLETERCLYPYNDLLNDTIDDIINIMETNNDKPCQ